MTLIDATEDAARAGAPPQAPLVTVVVPARNEQQSVGACLDSILAQTYRDIEVLVVDGRSTDRTRDVVLTYGARDRRIRLLDNPGLIVPTGLNVALAAARGRWLVRVDAHAVIPEDYVARAVAHLETGRWGGVGGRKIGIGRTPAGRAVAAAMESRFGVGNSTYHYVSRSQPVEHIPFGAYPVATAREIGGWDERLRVNQDFEFDYRMRLSGRELLFDPDIWIEWECRQRVRDLYRQYRRYGEGKVRVAILHPGSLRARHLAAPALVATAAVSAGLTLTGRRRAALASVAPYAAAVAAATARTAAPLDPAARSFVAPAFLAMHVGWGIGFWRGVGKALAAALRRPATVPDEH